MTDGIQSERSFVGRNVTVDPLSPAIAVADPEIKEILNLDDGEIIDVRNYISGKRYEELISARLQIRDRLSSKPMFGCAFCATPVYIVSTQEKHFFFRHIAEDGSCPAQTRGELSQDEIRARKYHGLRESEAHRKIKELIERSLNADPAFSDVHAEKQWRSAPESDSRRQPDVQASGPSCRIAFEAQLSTTFLDVVVARRAFYRDNGGLLIWVMRSFDPNYRRMTTDDLLFSNNSNILVIDEETTRRSEATGKFHMRCHYRVPARDGSDLIDGWESRIVCFNELTSERDAQRVWFFDYEGCARSIRAEIEREGGERQHAADEGLRERFFAFWVGLVPNAHLDEGQLEAWRALSQDFQPRGIILPHHPNRTTNFSALMNGLMSAKLGYPVGWGFRSLIEVAHRIGEGYPQHLAALGFALSHFEREQLLGEQDRKGKWQRRRIAIRQAMVDLDERFRPDAETMMALRFLFPEIAEKTQKLSDKWPMRLPSTGA